MNFFISSLAFLLLPFYALHAEIFLKNNLQQANKGDYLVIAQGKTYTLFHVFDKSSNTLTIEEITVPQDFAQSVVRSWKEWILQNAPCHTSWVMYQIDTMQGKLERYYSFTKQGAFTVPDAENFLSTLLKLTLYPVPETERKRVGPRRTDQNRDNRPLWAPPLVVEGKIIQGVKFIPYFTSWPQDGGLLSGKTILVYLPENQVEFPSYFPYWLEVKGVIGTARVRIADSGKGLKSPKTGYPNF